MYFCIFQGMGWTYTAYYVITIINITGMNPDKTFPNCFIYYTASILSNFYFCLVLMDWLEIQCIYDKAVS